MDKSTISALIGLSFVFVCGFGWGQWFAERSIRKDRSRLDHERMIISVPMNKDDAQATFELLSEIIKKVKSERGND